MAYSEHFWNGIAGFYSRKPVADEERYQRKLAVTRTYFKPDFKVLEFGCGTGTTAVIHAPHVASYTAIDVSAKMIAIAEEKKQKSGLAHLHFQKSALEDFPSVDEGFDMILGLSILHLLSDPAAAIRRVHRMLKPGGYFVTSTACIGDSMPIFRRIAPLLGGIGVIPKLKFIDRVHLEGLINQSGFVTAHHSPETSSEETLFLISRKI